MVCKLVYVAAASMLAYVSQTQGKLAIPATLGPAMQWFAYMYTHQEL